MNLPSSFGTNNAILSDEELKALLTAAQGNIDGRVDPRHAFFTTVLLRSATETTLTISAFSREISRSGLGLLHAAQIFSREFYEVDIRIVDLQVRRNAQVIWCRPVGNGWYLSGCRFV